MRCACFCARSVRDVGRGDVSAAEPARLEALHRDLNDGDDLAQAMTLIADALQRRIQQLRTSVEEVTAEGDPEDPRLGRLLERTATSVQRYEAAFDRRSTELGEIVEEFQRFMDDTAEAIEDIRRG